MAIYFGNLDRELADRQNVLKEDAARQYRGYRDVQQNFGSLGTTVSSSIKDVAQAKLDAAKLEYNVSRNQEADEIRAEQHSQSTTRNRELSLQAELKNIEGFNKVKIREHIGQQWYWRDPKAVRASYDDRMKIFTADKINLDETDRIKNYPNLFGTEALILLGEYNELLKAKANNVPGFTDADLKTAKDKLPLTPMNFMDWAKDTGQFNEKITGSPSRIGGAMYTSALQRYGYNIPDVTKLYKQATEASASPAGVVVKKRKDDTNNDFKDLGIDISGDAEKAAASETIGDEIKIESTGGIWMDKSGVKHPVDTFMEGNLDDETVTSVGDMSGDALKAAATEAEGSTTAGKVEPLSEQQLPEETQSAVQNVIDANQAKVLAANEANALRMYDKRPRFNQEQAVANSFSVAAEVVAPAANAASSIILPRDEIKRDPSDELYTLQGPERDRDSAFFPFMEASRGRKLGAYYSKLPSYVGKPETWENVSDEEKKRILEHPDIVEFGASPKSVAGLIKAEDELKQIDKQILFINGQVSGKTDDSSGSETVWDIKKGEWHVGKDPSSGNIPELTSNIFPGGGRLSKEAQGPISIVKNQQAKDIAKQLPRLENRRKQLAERVKNAEADVYASKSDKSKSTYRGSLASDFGVSNTFGPFIPSTMRPKDISPSKEDGGFLPNVISQQPSGDEGYQAAVDAEEQQKIYKTAVKTIIDKEGHGTEGEGHMYFDGEKPTASGDFNAEGSQNLVLAGGNNIYDTINSITNKGKREKELEEVATGLFGKGGKGSGFLGFGMNNKDEFLHYMNMPKKDHKAYYSTHEQRGAVKLSRLQRNYLTDYSMDNHLGRLIEKHPYLNNIARYPKEMQLFIMDNAFNMGPGWLGKFKKMEVHLKKWVQDGYKKSDLKLVMKEYKDSDHFKKKISKARALENYGRLESMLG